MKGPPAARPATETTIREVENKAREFEFGRRVRIVNDEVQIIDVCGADRLQRYLQAPNAELVRANSGKIVAIKLLSVGNDRGHLGEHHGSSVLTTRTEQDQTEHRWIDGRNVRPGIRHPYSPLARSFR